jgi:hypothetical protein
MELSFILMEPYHRLLRKNEWSVEEQQRAVQLIDMEDLSWTQYYNGISLSIHLISVEMYYRINGRQYAELADLREKEYAHIYLSFDQGTPKENRDKRKSWYFLCDTAALVHRLVQEDP